MGGPARIGRKALRCTDNFLDAPMKLVCTVVDGERSEERLIEWRTCEHFFQASKFDAELGGAATWSHCRGIQQTHSAIDAWSLGQSRSHPLRSDWEEIKAHAMYLAVHAKFDQYPSSAALLAHTTESIQAAPSTSNWQTLNSIVLERVRYEMQEKLDINQPPDESRQQAYFEWCKATDLPQCAKPVMVYLAPSTSDNN